MGESFIFFVIFLKYVDCVLFKIVVRELIVVFKILKMFEKKVDKWKERLNLFEVVIKIVNGW